MVKFRGKDYFDERQIIDVLLEENEQLKTRIAEQERTLNALKEIVNFVKEKVK